MYLLSNSCRPEGELVNKWKEKGLQGTRVFYARENYTFGSVIPEFLPKNEYQHWVELNLQTSSRICCFQFLNSRYIWEWRNNPTGISWVGKVREVEKILVMNSPNGHHSHFPSSFKRKKMKLIVKMRSNAIKFNKNCCIMTTKWDFSSAQDTVPTKWWS